jgi:hypothetical protein
MSKSPKRKERVYVKQRSVFVLKEKHAERYYVVDSDEDLFRIALNVVRGRLKSGYWYHEPGLPPPPPDYSEEDVLKMPKSLQAGARKKVQDYKQASREWDEENRGWLLVQEVCSVADGRKAMEFLESRSDHAYEGFSLEPADTTDY